MSATMRAVSLRDGTLALRDVAMPVPGEGQILVRTLACAICASDHHYMDHPEVALADRSGMRVSDPSRDVVMGHEFCAEVVAYGPGTDKKLPIGTRVTSPPVLFGARGMQIVGMTPDAPGGFGEYFLLNEGFARALPDDLPPERLALVDAMAVGWYYTRVGAEEKNAVPLVIGLGAIGLSAVVALKQRGTARSSRRTSPRRAATSRARSAPTCSSIRARRRRTPRGAASRGARPTRCTTASSSPGRSAA